ncbi:hypothetical protein BV25DRAFT_1918237 [Artomyces pyxidatus]|uniref:Uncharacterized protein n=1 Tax=Artomyces pyxidatus TaxID=48021 RepID=A0ACB8SV99_9AGAM|nr:hypothetical protein BV25DRAFT_1918237 [Artomyces pyxidatus]
MLLILSVYASLAQSVASSPVSSPTFSTWTNDTASFSLRSSTSATGTCTDIAICRTRYTIIWSSLVTILACVWTAVHRNISEPERTGESRFRRILGRILEAAKIVVVTLLVPEWVLGWAVRQYLSAREIGMELEDARAEAMAKWTAKLASMRKMVQKRRMGSEIPQENTNPELAQVPESFSSASERLEDAQRASAGDPEKSEDEQHAAAGDPVKSEDEQLEHALDEWTVMANEQASRFEGRWTSRHGFFVTMGGFYYYKDGKPQHPLSRSDVVNLVRSGDIVPPTEEEIRGWSQGDALSKTLAVIQTFWFILQAIARHTEHLPITQLEVMTLAYTTITVVMYVAWWDKPQNVSGPVRVAVKELPEPAPVESLEWSTRFVHVMLGTQDNDVTLDLRKERRVPTFYSGRTESSDLTPLFQVFAAIVFGAVHCAAWKYEFPSHAEKVIWRVSSLILVALPGGFLVLALVAAVTTSMAQKWQNFQLNGILKGVVTVVNNVFIITMGVISFLFIPTYVAARLLLLALSFSTLRLLPYDAYRAVQWTLLIPHFT